MAELLLVGRGAPAAVEEEIDRVVCGIGCRPAQGTEEGRVEVDHTRNLVIEDRRAVGEGAVGFAKRTTAVAAALATEVWGTVRVARRATVLAAEALDGRWGRRGR